MDLSTMCSVVFTTRVQLSVKKRNFILHSEFLFPYLFCFYALWAAVAGPLPSSCLMSPADRAGLLPVEIIIMEQRRPESSLTGSAVVLSC